MAKDKDIANSSATTVALMERFKTVDELAYADLDELTKFIDETGRNFADPAAKAKAIQTAARNSYRLPITMNNSVNQAMAVSIATMRALGKQIKVLDKAIEQQFEIIPNTLTSIPGIGKACSAGIIAEIVGEQVRDVLAGGLARLFPGFGDFAVQVEVNLGTEVLSGWHGGHSFPLVVTQVYPKGMANAITTTKEWQTNEAKPPKGTAVERVSPQAFVLLILLDVFSWQPGAGRKNEKRP